MAKGLAIAGSGFYKLLKDTQKTMAFLTYANVANGESVHFPLGSLVSYDLSNSVAVTDKLKALGGCFTPEAPRDIYMVMGRITIVKKYNTYTLSSEHNLYDRKILSRSSYSWNSERRNFNDSSRENSGYYRMPKCRSTKLSERNPQYLASCSNRRAWRRGYSCLPGNRRLCRV